MLQFLNGNKNSSNFMVQLHMRRNDRIKEMKYFNYNYKHVKEDRKKDLIHCLGKKKQQLGYLGDLIKGKTKSREKKEKKYIWDSMYAS